MKQLLSLAAIVGLCLVGPVTAGAATVEVGKITCAELLDMDETEVTVLYVWLDGYASAKSGNTTLNSDNMESDLETLAKMCKSNTKAKVLDLINN